MARPPVLSQSRPKSNSTAEEQYLRFAATLRCCVPNNMSSEILNSAVPGDKQVADRVSTAGPREDFMTLSTAISCLNTVCWNTCARYAGRTHLVTYTLIWECKAHPFFFGAVIFSLWLTIFRHSVRTSNHDEASQSITTLNFFDNEIGDDGARALADAVKAILVRWF